VLQNLSSVDKALKNRLNFFKDFNDPWSANKSDNETKIFSKKELFGYISLADPTCKYQ